MSTPRQREKQRQIDPPAPDEPSQGSPGRPHVHQSDTPSDCQQCVENIPEEPEDTVVLAHISWVLLSAKSVVEKENIPFFELVIDGLLVVLTVLVSVSHQYSRPFESSV